MVSGLDATVAFDLQHRQNVGRYIQHQARDHQGGGRLQRGTAGRGARSPASGPAVLSPAYRRAAPVMPAAASPTAARHQPPSSTSTSRDGLDARVGHASADHEDFHHQPGPQVMRHSAAATRAGSMPGRDLRQGQHHEDARTPIISTATSRPQRWVAGATQFARRTPTRLALRLAPPAYHRQQRRQATRHPQQQGAEESAPRRRATGRLGNLQQAAAARQRATS